MSNENFENTDYEGQLNEVAASIKKAEEFIAKHDCLRRLTDNPEFKELILEDYLEQEAARAVGLICEPSIVTGGEAGKKMVDNVITGISALRQYFIKIERMGNGARDDMGDFVLTQSEILQEQEDATKDVVDVS